MKARPLLPVAVDAAREVLALADVQRPRDIDVQAIAMRLGMRIQYGPMSTSRGWLVRGGDHAIVYVAEDARGEPRGDHTVAHEAGHFKMHKAADHFAQCDDESAKGTKKKAGRGDRAFWMEIEANHFSTELRMPESLVTPFCAMPSPTLDHMSRLTRFFPTSLSSAGLRFTQLAPAPCAWVFSAGGVVKWASESASFPGTIAKDDALHPSSVAHAVQRKRAGTDDDPREVPGAAWRGKTPFLEHAIGLGPEIGVMSWIVPLA